jgi:uncharacterized protein YdeI (YjbR/CyaY-like superfamily)
MTLPLRTGRKLRRMRRKQQVKSRLSRPIQPMPAAVRAALGKRGLMSAYRGRPAYQQNDYLAWIDSAKVEVTKAKRLAQMLDELDEGDVYMKMKWNPVRRTKAHAVRG